MLDLKYLISKENIQMIQKLGTVKNITRNVNNEISLCVESD